MISFSEYGPKNRSVDFFFSVWPFSEIWKLKFLSCLELLSYKNSHATGPSRTRRNSCILLYWVSQGEWRAFNRVSKQPILTTCRYYLPDFTLEGVKIRSLILVVEIVYLCSTKFLLICRVDRGGSGDKCPWKFWEGQGPPEKRFFPY